MLQRSHLFRCAGAVVLTVLSLYLAGCSDPQSKARGEFLAGCVQGGASKAVCGCVYERLEQRFTREELAEFTKPSVTAPPQRLMREGMQAAMACRKP